MSISDIMQLATNEIMTHTEDPILIMVNGVITILSRKDYHTLKAQNDKRIDKMKADIKIISKKPQESKQ